MIDRQLELGLENRSVYRPGNRRRSGRANWWFERMRGLVEEAHDWEAAAPIAESSEAPAVHHGPEAQPPPGSANLGLPNSSVAGQAAHWKFVRIRGVDGDQD